MHQVLLPGAPLFLAHVADGYDVTIHEARLVFLLCCMSLVFGNVFPALGHLVVLILCMVKTKNIDHIVFVTSCASYSYPEGKHRHEAQSKKYESVAHGRGICYSATLLIWNQVPEFMQPELEVTLFFFFRMVLSSHENRRAAASNSLHNSQKIEGFRQKTSSVDVCSKMMDSLLTNFPKVCVDIISDHRSWQDWILSCTVKTTNTSYGIPKDLRELRLGDVFGHLKKMLKILLK